ncbi:alanine:cation symporter family protein [Streptococcus sp. LPB0220]|uniref:alanine:cation symporter family protein n=1 Tax=Streptococcus sp. LPB0220 TaxID=2610896 RepID=UPI0021E6D323|nr:alanine:cation symporter family protein [Streptococcus sp. LPB0220]
MQFFQQLDNLVWNAPLLLLLVMVGLGGFLKLYLVWVIADIVNGLMALPNLIALLALSPVIIKESKRYFKK